MLLPVAALEALLTAKTPTAAAANDEMVVCVNMTGLCAAAGWAAVLAAVPASAKADQAASKLGQLCQKYDLRNGTAGHMLQTQLKLGASTCNKSCCFWMISKQISK